MIKDINFGEHKIYDSWRCPNCGYYNKTKLFDDKVCELCGWSDEQLDKEPRAYK